MSPLSNILRQAGTGIILLGWALPTLLEAQTLKDVSFNNLSQKTVEGESVYVTVELSAPSSTVIEVPFHILDSSTATLRIVSDGEIVTDGDYYIEEDVSETDYNQFLFDPSTRTGSVTFAQYATSRSFSLTVYNDTAIEGEETIVFEFPSDLITDAQPVAPLTHTVFIQDEDEVASTDPVASIFDYTVYFKQKKFQVKEGDSVSIPILFRRSTPEQLELTWSYRLVPSAPDEGEAAAELAALIAEGKDPASLDDIDLSDLTSSDETANGFVKTIASSTSSSTISFPTIIDGLAERGEIFYLSLVSLKEPDDGDATTVENVYAVDPTEISIEILDGDTEEATVQIDLSSIDESYRDGITLREGNSSYWNLPITLSHPLAYTVFIPISFEGTATRGTLSDSDTVPDGTDYYITSEENSDEELGDFVYILEGETSTTVSIKLNNDLIIEDPATETVTLKLGTPRIFDLEGDDGIPFTLPLGGTTEAEKAKGERTSFTITIKDDDPTELGFFVPNPALDDADATEDLDRYIPYTARVVSESEGDITVQIVLSSYAPEDITTTFEIEVVSEDTTATMYDFNLSSKVAQDWDFYVYSTSPQLKELDTPVEATIAANSQVYSLNIVLNNDAEPALPIEYLEQFLDSSAEDLPDTPDADVNLADIERDEYIHLRITAVTNTEESGVLLRSDAADFFITIRDMPDINVTSEFTGLTLQTDNCVDGKPFRNPLTAMHELHYRFEPTAALVEQLERLRGNAEDDYAGAKLRGYTAYKVAFRTGIYDVANPDADSNDDLQSSLLSNGEVVDYTPDGFTEFFQIVDSPFTLRFASGFDLVKIAEGEEQTSSTGAFSDENADTYFYDQFVLQPLNFGDIDDDTRLFDPREGFFEVGDPMDFLIEFSNHGKRDFQTDRLNVALHPEAIQIYLTSNDDISYETGTTFSGMIKGMEEIIGFDQIGGDDKKEILLQLYNPTGGFRIEYMDEGGEWRAAQPGRIYDTTTIYNWIDQGPPKTNKHPSESKFRLYRVSNSN